MKKTRKNKQMQEAKEKSFLDFFKTAPCQDVHLDTTRSKDLPRELPQLDARHLHE